MPDVNPPDDAPLPYRAPEIGPAAMKAFAHPLRMSLYQHLVDHGPATATTLGRALGESSGQTSYHLRQLEKHGFVTEDTGRGSGRERWWQSQGFSVQGTRLAKDPATAAPTRLYLQTAVEQKFDTLRGWLLRAMDEPAEWVRASMDSSATASLTAPEATALGNELLEVIERHTDAAKAAGGADRDDARRFRVYLDLIPLAPPEGGTGTPAPGDAARGD